MADMLARGMEWLTGQLRQHASQEVTYTLGSLTITAVPATIGESTFERESQDGLRTDVRSKDFLIPTADLQVDGTPVEPEPGALITVPGLGTYEVFTPGGSEPAWRYSDPHRTMLRIHTREIEAD